MRITLPNGKWRKRLKIKALPPFAELHKVRAGNYKIFNLDIDNLIFITKESERIKIYSGALEFVCPEYSILDIVAKNIDGGLDSIRKRWKRYEKVTYL